MGGRQAKVTHDDGSGPYVFLTPRDELSIRREVITGVVVARQVTSSRRVPLPSDAESRKISRNQTCGRIPHLAFGRLDRGARRELGSLVRAASTRRVFSYRYPWRKTQLQYGGGCTYWAHSASRHQLRCPAFILGSFVAVRDELRRLRVSGDTYPQVGRRIPRRGVLKETPGLIP